MKVIARLTLHVCLLAGACFAAAPVPEAANPGEELARMAGISGHYGGHPTVGPRGRPQTLNPGTPPDAGSRGVIRRLMGRLNGIKRTSAPTEPGLPESGEVSVAR